MDGLGVRLQAEEDEMVKLLETMRSGAGQRVGPAGPA